MKKKKDYKDYVILIWLGVITIIAMIFIYAYVIPKSYQDETLIEENLTTEDPIPYSILIDCKWIKDNVNETTPLPYQFIELCKIYYPELWMESKK